MMRCEIFIFLFSVFFINASLENEIVPVWEKPGCHKIGEYFNCYATRGVLSCSLVLANFLNCVLFLTLLKWKYFLKFHIHFSYFPLMGIKKRRNSEYTFRLKKKKKTRTNFTHWFLLQAIRAK